MKGTIRTDEPPAAVAGAEVTIVMASVSPSDKVTSDRQGHDEPRVLPGPVYTQVLSMPPELRTLRTDRRAVEQTGQVPAGLKEFELPPIVLAATPLSRGR